MTSDRKNIGQLTIIKIAGAILGVTYSIIQVQYFGASREIEVYFAAVSVIYLVTSLAQSGQLTELFLTIFHKNLNKDGKVVAKTCLSVVHIIRF